MYFVSYDFMSTLAEWRVAVCVSKLIEAEWRIYASVNKQSLFQMMACRLSGAKLLSETMLEWC